MKKTQFIELIHLIRKTKVAFISVVIFIILSFAFYLGMGWTGRMTAESVDYYLNDHHVRDLEVISSLPISEENISEISNNPDILEIEGSRIQYGELWINDCKYQTCIREITQNVDEIILKEGRLPSNENEIVMDYIWANNEGINVGDTLEIDNSLLTKDRFTITGFVCDSGFACSQSGIYGVSPINHGSIDVQLYCIDDAFGIKDYGYNDLLVRFKSLRGLNYTSSEYKDKINEINDSFVKGVEAVVSEENEIRGVVLTSSGHIIASENVIRVLNNLKWSLATLFLLIGFLVCYCTITRLVYSQSVLIGSMKSYGFTEGEIYKRFFLYTGFAYLIGSVFGIILSIFVEFIMGNTDKSIFLCERIQYVYSWQNILILLLVEFVGLMSATYLSVCAVIKREPIELLQDVKEDESKQLFFERCCWWEKQSFINKMVVKNIFNDSRRVISTIIGIVSCTALLVVSIYFSKNILDSKKQVFSDEIHFDQILLYDPESEKAGNDIEEVLKSEGLDYVKVAYDYGKISGLDSSNISLDIIITDNSEDLKKLVTIKPKIWADGASPDSGLWTNYSYKNYYGDDADLSVDVTTIDGKERKLELSGYFDLHSAASIMFITEDEYIAQFETEPEYNCFLIRNFDINQSDLNRKVNRIDGFISLQSYKEHIDNLFSTFIIIVLSISGVYTLMAIIMSFLTVYSILFQFLMDRKKEIIVMLLNGYDEAVARKYISTDVIIQTGISIILGGIVGEIIGYISVCSFDTPSMYFMRGFKLLPILGGAIATVVLIYAVTKSILSNIAKFSLEDITTTM